MKPNLDEVIKILQQEGFSNEQIKTFLENLSNSLSLHLHMMIVEVLTKEEMAQLNTIVEDIQKQNNLRFIVEKRLGVKLDEVSKKYVEDFTSKFIEEYKNSNTQ